MRIAEKRYGYTQLPIISANLGTCASGKPTACLFSSAFLDFPCVHLRRNRDREGPLALF